MNKNELKNAIREEAAARLENTDEEYRSSASAAIAVNVLALPEMKKARSVMLYVFRDAYCSRLGHGAGYYDRFLQTPDDKCTTIALCYDKLLMNEIAMEEHDMKVDAVITEKAVHRWRPGR